MKGKFTEHHFIGDEGEAEPLHEPPPDPGHSQVLQTQGFGNLHSSFPPPPPMGPPTTTFPPPLGGPSIPTARPLPPPGGPTGPINPRTAIVSGSRTPPASHGSRTPPESPHVASAIPALGSQAQMQVPRASDVWHVDQAFSLGGNIGKLENDMIQRLDVSQYASISKAVQALNVGTVICVGGICIVYSSSHCQYFLLLRTDKIEEGIKLARETFNVHIEESALRPEPRQDLQDDPVSSTVAETIRALEEKGGSVSNRLKSAGFDTSIAAVPKSVSAQRLGQSVGDTTSLSRMEQAVNRIEEQVSRLAEFGDKLDAAAHRSDRQNDNIF